MTTRSQLDSLFPACEHLRVGGSTGRALQEPLYTGDVATEKTHSSGGAQEDREDAADPPAYDIRKWDHGNHERGYADLKSEVEHHDQGVVKREEGNRDSVRCAFQERAVLGITTEEAAADRRRPGREAGFILPTRRSSGLGARGSTQRR